MEKFQHSGPGGLEFEIRALDTLNLNFGEYLGKINGYTNRDNEQQKLINPLMIQKWREAGNAGGMIREKGTK